MSIPSKLKEFILRADKKRREFAVLASNFALENKNALVIIADPDTDVILISHGGVQVPVRFVEPGTGKRMHIVANALHYLNRKTDKSLDQFLLAVDSGLYNLAAARYHKRRSSVAGKALAFMGANPKRPEFEENNGLTKSPFQLKNAAEESIDPEGDSGGLES